MRSFVTISCTKLLEKSILLLKRTTDFETRVQEAVSEPVIVESAECRRNRDQVGLNKGLNGCPDEEEERLVSRFCFSNDSEYFSTQDVKNYKSIASLLVFFSLRRRVRANNRKNRGEGEFDFSI